MRRTICKWYVSRSIDTQKPIPAWVQRSIDNDPVLQRYQSQWTSLESRLRNDRAELVHGFQVRQPEKVTVPNFASRPWANKTAWGVLALAASVGILWFAFWPPAQTTVSQNTSEPSAIENGVASEQMVAKKPIIDASKLAQEIKRGLAIVNALKSKSNTSGILESQMESALRDIIAGPVQASLIASKDATQRTYAAVDHGFITESDRVVHDVQAGTQYFVQTLPSRLIGLVRK